MSRMSAQTRFCLMCFHEGVLFEVLELFREGGRLSPRFLHPP